MEAERAPAALEAGGGGDAACLLRAECSALAPQTNGVTLDCSVECAEDSAVEFPSEPASAAVAAESVAPIDVSSKSLAASIPNEEPPPVTTDAAAETSLEELKLELSADSTDIAVPLSPKLEPAQNTETLNLHSSINIITASDTHGELEVHPTNEKSFEISQGSPDDDYDLELHVTLGPEAGSITMSELTEPKRSTEDSLDDSETTTNIIDQLQKHNMDFTEALASHGSNEGSENNNFVKQEEVMNRKELLDILEGNEPEDDGKKDILGNSGAEELIKIVHIEAVETISVETEPMLALRQLSSLPDRRKQSRAKRNREREASVKTASLLKIKDVKSRGRPRKSTSQISEPNTTPAINKEEIQEASKSEAATKSPCSIKVLVEEWCDDEPEESEVQLETVEDMKEPIDETENSKSEAIYISTEKPTEIEEQEIKSIEDSSMKAEKPPQRRMSRVIKKKIIFDPDNPDTFTSKKSPNVKAKTLPDDKEQPPTKKGKTDVSPHTAKDKSPIMKPKNHTTHWKKPQPKNSKQHKRLSEVDKLLMDEGAVNMLYQLNSNEPEAPKGKKNIKTKAAFIKKITETTPDTKFRERRKDVKSEEGPGEKRSSGRKRISCSNPVQSPSACEDFEAHSADDSIIYRRHSSSSYSSSCLSPRRLSIDAGTVQTIHVPPQPGDPLPSDVKEEHNTNGDKFEDVFMSDKSGLPKADLDKNDCLSLKEKLNSKLSRVFNVKRKRDGKTDKIASKQKKLMDKRFTENQNYILPEFKKLSVTFDERVAVVNILREGTTNNIYDIETVRELRRALEHIDRKPDVSVTLLVSDSGNLCGGLDLGSVLQHKTDKRFKRSSELADSIRSLFVCLEQHSKFVASGVDGQCVGVGLALLALCDVVVASDRATFAMLAGDTCGGATIVPGTAVLTSHRKSLCRSLITEMLVFGRQLSATEALQRGLVSRTLWPDRFNSELRAMVKDIAAQPVPTLQLKKKLLSLRNGSEPKSTFLSCLETECDLLAAYWASPEGQSALQSAD